jgi:ketosteroid isomerase-like protein
MTTPLAVAQNFYSFLENGNLDAALGLLDRQIEWTEAERTPYYCGVMRGAEAVAAGLFAPLSRDFSSFSSIPDEFVAQGARVIAFGTYSGLARRTGRALSTPFVHSWTVAEGRLRRFVQYTDAAAWNEALDGNSIT